MSIHVADDKKIIVKVPLGTPTFVAENFIREKKTGLQSSLKKWKSSQNLLFPWGRLQKKISDKSRKRRKRRFQNCWKSALCCT